MHEKTNNNMIGSIVDAPQITSINAQPSLDFPKGYNPGCTITLEFDVATDLAGYELEQNLTKSAVDQLFAFSQPLGSDYVGRWSTNKTFVITMLNTTGVSSPPKLGQFTVTSQARGLIRAWPFSPASSQTSPTLEGSFFG